MVGERRAPGLVRIVLLGALAAGVAACGSGPPPGSACPPGSTSGTVTVAQVQASEAEIVACPTSPDSNDECYGGTAWSVGDGLFATAAHVIENGAFGPTSTTRVRTYLQVTQGFPSAVDGRALTNASVVTMNIDSSDVALVQTTDLFLPPLPIWTTNVTAGLSATDVCDANTIDNLTPLPITNVFSGTTTAVGPSGVPPGAGPATLFNVNVPASRPGTPEGCSGSPVLVDGRIAGSLDNGNGTGQLGGGSSGIIPAPALRSALNLSAPSGACPTGQPAPLPKSLQSVPTGDLPSGSGTYNDATCPWSTTCLAVGTAGGHGVVTRTTNSAGSWSTGDVPGATTLTAISCPSLDTCYAGGTASGNRPAMFVTNNSGQSWSGQTVPSAAVIGSIGCGSTTSCIAVGSSSVGPDYVSTEISTTDGGSSWTSHAAPANNLTEVRCIGPTQCWVAGPGAWFTSNLGASWRDLSPKQVTTGCPSGSGFGLCDGTYTQTIDIEFQTATDGWVVGGSQCGGEGATECSGAVYDTTNGGTSWSLWSGSTKEPFGWQIFCSADRCLYVANTFTHSELFGTEDGSTWLELTSIPALASSLACPPVGTFCILAGGLKNEATLDVLQFG